MSIRGKLRLAPLRLNTRILLLVGLPVLVTVVLTTVMVHWSTNRFVEDAVGDQMMVQARIVASLVAVAEQARDKGMTPEEINQYLTDIAHFAKEQKGYYYEFWITDPTGKVYLGTEKTEFTFQPDQPQAGVFLQLLEGHANHVDYIVQESRRREIDPFVYKYVGVSGVDKSRIVEVGYRTETLFAELARKNALLAAGVSALLLIAGVGAAVMLRRIVTSPLDQLIRAAKDVESEQYRIGSLANIGARGDELGHLARVFEDMVGKLAERYESLVNCMRAVVIKLRGDRTIAFANEYATELLGYTNEELIGQKLDLIVPPEWHDEVQGRLDSLQGQELQVDAINENIGKSGDRFWIAWSNRLIKVGDGQEQELLCVGNNITVEMRQRARRNLEGRVLREAMTISSETDSFAEALRRCVSIICELNGWSMGHAYVPAEDGTDKLVPTGVWHIHRESESYEVFRERIEGTRFARGAGLPGRIWSSGEPAWLANLQNDADPSYAELCRGTNFKGAFGFPIKVGDQIVAVLQFFTDEEIAADDNLLALVGTVGEQVGRILERQRAEMALHEAKLKAEEATELKSIFLANMSHEIRTPMNAVIGLSHLALKTDLTARQRDYVAKIHNAGISLLAIINDILDFSKIEAGKLDIESTEFRLDDVIASVCNITAQKAQEKGLELLVAVAQDLPWRFVGDPLRLGQVITNLFNNAIKFTENGEIRLKVEMIERTGEKVCLKFAVKDTGVGMTREQASRLFQPFTQADMSTTRKHGGTGLGLTISLRIVELMGGRIWLESEPGVGSTFYFTVWLGIGSERQRNRSLPDQFKSLRAMIVDDKEAAREILVDTMRGLSQSVSAFASGPEAIEALRQHDATDPYNVVLMDWQMPGMDGLQATQLIRDDAQLLHQPAIIMVTAFGREEIREEAERVNVDGFLVKPVTKSMLMDALVGILAPGVDAPQNVTTGEPAIHLNGVRVLLAEDNEINQQIAIELLEGVGASVAVADNGRIVVDMLFGSPQGYDIVLMDLQMPEMDGFQATTKIRSDGRFAELPIVAMTAHATIEERQRCLMSGMNDHIAKPIDPVALYDTVRRYCRTEAAPEERLPSAEPVPCVGEVPEIDGIDTANGLRRVAGNRKLYLNLLRRFSEQQAVIPAEIIDHLNEGDSSTAERLAHTLKGVSGNIGAGEVQAKAAAVESAIREQQPVPAVLELVADARQSLERVIAAIQAVVPPEEAATRPVAALDWNEVRHLIARLELLLSEDDAEASEVFTESEDVLSTGLGSAAGPIRECLRNYDFEAALSLLREAKARMPELL